MEPMLVGQREYQPLSMDISLHFTPLLMAKHPLFLEIMDHALNLKTPTFSMKLPTSIGSIFSPACRARGTFTEVLLEKLTYKIAFLHKTVSKLIRSVSDLSHSLVINI